MLKLVLNPMMMLVFAMSIFSIGCSSDEFEESDISNYESTFAAASSVGDRADCFEFVFPVQLTLNDGEVVDIADAETLKDTIRAEVRANGRDAKPEFVYPLSIVVDDETIEVASSTELEEQAGDCFGSRGKRSGKANRGSKGKRGGRDGANHCYSLSYPVTFVFDDGSELAVNSREDARDAFKEYREANPDATEKPSLQFPVTVTLEDESTVEVSSQEELEALREACRASDDEDE